MAWSYYVYILDLCIISYKYLILSVCHQGIDIAPQETQKTGYIIDIPMVESDTIGLMLPTSSIFWRLKRRTMERIRTR